MTLSVSSMTLSMGERAGHHVSGCTTVVDDDKSLPGNSLLSVEDTVLLGDLAGPIGQKGDVALALQTTVSLRCLHEGLVGVDRVSGHGQHSAVELLEVVTFAVLAMSTDS